MATTPAPTAARLTGDDLRAIADTLADLGFGSDFQWSQSVTFPKTPEDLASEYTWVILNSPLKASVALGIFKRLWPAILAGRPASSEFGHKGKCAAIDRGWAERAAWWEEASHLKGEALLAWCVARPWIGPITKWHFAKNLGADVAKPDRWLSRLAETHEEEWDALCRRLAQETGWRVATVDLVLWRACAEKVIAPAPGGFVFGQGGNQPP